MTRQHRQQVVDEAALMMLVDPDGPDLEASDTERVLRHAARWSSLRPQLEALAEDFECVPSILAEVEVLA